AEKTVGDAPKSSSPPMSGPSGIVHDPSFFSAGDSLTIESVRAVLTLVVALPVEMYTFPAESTAGVDHTDPPILPLGTLENVPNRAPLLCLNPATPPRTKGMSQFDEMPT